MIGTGSDRYAGTFFLSGFVDPAAAFTETVSQGEGSRLSYGESYAKAFPFDKMISGMLDPEMMEGTVKIGNQAIKDKIQVNLTINHRAGGNAP